MVGQEAPRPGRGRGGKQTPGTRDGTDKTQKEDLANEGGQGMKDCLMSLRGLDLSTSEQQHELEKMGRQSERSSGVEGAKSSIREGGDAMPGRDACQSSTEASMNGTGTSSTHRPANYKTRLCMKWEQQEPMAASAVPGKSNGFPGGPFGPHAGWSGPAQYKDMQNGSGKGQSQHFGMARNAAVPQGGANVVSTNHKTRLCTKFMQFGHCQYGDKCNFAHGEQELHSNNAGALSMRRFQQDGMGARGAGYAGEMSHRVGYGGAVDVASKGYGEGAARGYGTDGGGAAGGGGARGADEGAAGGAGGAAARQSNFKTRICMNWQQQGHCSYGAQCSFAHGAHELRGTGKDGAFAGPPSGFMGSFGMGPMPGYQMHPNMHPNMPEMSKFPGGVVPMAGGAMPFGMTPMNMDARQYMPRMVYPHQADGTTEDMMGMMRHGGVPPHMHNMHNMMPGSWGHTQGQSPNGSNMHM